MTDETRNVQSTPARRFLPFFFLILIIFSYFAFLGHLPLFEPDEGRYAEIPREMLASGDFITPTLNYVKYFEKPILHYWLTAGAFRVFGLKEFSARFFSAFFALLGIFGVYFLAKRLYDKATALTSALVLGGSIIWYVIARVNVIDMEVSSLVSLSLISFFLWEAGNLTGKDRDEYFKTHFPKGRFYLAGFYGLAALATLSKGLIGLVLPGGIVFWYIIGTRRFRLFKRMGMGWGIPLYFLIVLPWFLAVSLRNPGFAWFFFIHEHFLRYTKGISHSESSLFYYIPIIIGGLLPFTAYLIPALKAPVKRVWKSRIREGQAEFFLLLWIVLIILFFSFSKGKLPTYILPVFPPFAVLIGRYIRRCQEKWDRTGRFPGIHWGGIGTACLFPVAALAAPFVQNHYPVSEVFLYAMLPFALSAAAVGGAILWSRRKKGGIEAWLFLTSVCLILGLTPLIARAFAPYRSVKTISKIVANLAKPDEPVIALEHYWQGLPFYARRRVVVVNYCGELDFGIRHAPDREKWFWDFNRFLKVWRSSRRIWVVVSDKGFKESDGKDDSTVREKLGPLCLVAREGYVNLITNVPYKETMESFAFEAPYGISRGIKPLAMKWIEGILKFQDY